jgi:8-amino-7-oxononanoate synthase
VSWSEWIDTQLGEIRQSGRWRSPLTLEGQGPDFSLPDRSSAVSFASNDYLGLSRHPEVVAAAHDALDRFGTGSGSSRLIVGSRPIHADLESMVAGWRGTERALMFSTGYVANLAVLSTLGAGARLVSDELNHASIIDGTRLARSEVCIYRHGDVEHAAHLVGTAQKRTLLVTDTVFSMDGDVAPIVELSELCLRTGSMLVLDDAHAVLEVPTPDPGVACVRIGTLSKMLGSLGGYVAATAPIVDLLINRSRTFIFTTAPTAADTAAAIAAIGICRSEEGELLRKRLRENIDAFLPGHPSPIVPVVLGSEELAIKTSSELLERGFVVPAIRPPTVPPNTSRLRIAFSALHTREQVGLLRSALDRSSQKS